MLTGALTGFAPVINVPSVGAQGPGGKTYITPGSPAAPSIVDLFQLMIVSSTPSSPSSVVAKPVTVFPLTTGVPVSESKLPGEDNALVAEEVRNPAP